MADNLESMRRLAPSLIFSKFSTRDRGLFIHNPRTGGNSVAHTIGCPHDHRYAWIAREQHADWDNVFSFAFVRNTWSRIASWYLYHSGTRREIELYQMPFRKWVLGGCKHHWRFDPFSQRNYVCDPQTNEIIVKRVCRYENYYDELRFLCDKFYVQKKKFPHYMRSRAYELYQRMYDDETRYYVHERWRNEITLFGFKF